MGAFYLTQLAFHSHLTIAEMRDTLRLSSSFKPTLSRFLPLCFFASRSLALFLTISLSPFFSLSFNLFLHFPLSLSLSHPSR